jgi:biopolymer transport protein ExbD
MTWNVRHEGSPQAVQMPSAKEVLEGLSDGLWEPTDEVRGPADSEWVPLENHPTFAEAAADIDPKPPHHFDDETHLDMNALIDVCLVLLIFFILTTSYAALQSRLESPDINPDNTTGPLVIVKEDVPNQMIYVTAKMENGKPVIRIENTVVEQHKLTAELKRFVGNTRKTTLLLEVEPKVPHGITVSIQDAAKAAGMKKVLRLVK